mgnify:CR=1 FL=1
MRDEIIKIKEKVKELEDRVTKLENIVFQDSSFKPLKKKISIREFILQKKPKTATQKVLVIGYYLEHFEKMECFTVKDVENGLRQAKEYAGKNISDLINKNIKKGYVMECKEKNGRLKTFTLTNSGEKFVENELGK